MQTARRAALAVVALVGAALALAPSAAAAPLGTWLLPPTAIGEPSTQIPWSPLVASGGTGTPTTAVLWMFDRTISIAIRRGSGAFGAPIEITDNVEGGSPAIAVAPDGATWVAHAGTGASDQGAGVVRVAPDGTVGDETVLTTRPAYGENVAVGADGTVVVAWSELSADAYAVRAALRTPGGTWSDVVTLSTGGQNYGPKIAIGPDGATLIAWGNGPDFMGSTGVQYATRTGVGDFSSPRTLDAGDGTIDDPLLGITADGTVVVAWSQNWRMRVASRAPGGTFGAITTLPLPSGTAKAYAPALAVGADGAVAIAWVGSDADYHHEAIYAAVRGASGGFGAPVTLASGSDRYSGASAAIAGDGSAVIGWTAVDGSTNRVRTATAPPGGGFDAPVTIDTATDTRTGDDRAGVAAPRLAVVPDGRLTAAFFSATSTNATFETATTGFTVDVRTRNGALGRVTSDAGGIDCGAECVGTYASGATVTLTARGVGGLFAGWGGACSGTAPTCTVDVDASKRAVARFAVAPEAEFRAAPGGQAAPVPVDPATPSAPVEVATTLVAPGPGTFTQSGSVVASRRSQRAARVCQARLRVSGAGTYALRCRINAATRAELRRHAIRIAITTRFTAPNGRWSEATRVIVLPRIKTTPRPEPVTG